MSETLALLLTDIVDSTLLTERLGDAAMAQVWAAHDRCARDLLAAWRGREIDKSDGFLLAFANAADAVGCALAYHRAVGRLAVPLAARAAVHVGPLTQRATAADDIARGAKAVELDGLAKPVVARVMALAGGGQTLLTAPAAAALDGTGHRVQSHGHWRMKGIEAPLELFEVGDDHAAFTPPADSAKAWRVVRRHDLWLPRRELRHTLPAERDAFIGRDAALRELARRFERGARLVSVLGMGGTGKTRLAQRFGWAWLGDFSGGVWFCDLAGARDLDGIVRGVAQGLELPLGRADPVTQIGAALAGRGECLVILDNFEQLTQHAQATLGQWLDRAADARFIVTTRALLGLPGEETLALAPLPAADAATLFLRRAEAGGVDFRPSAEDRAAIDPLVRLLDGLPLAIELCAARTRLIPPRRLLERMSQRFKLLTSNGGRHDRQATLRATFDWSWDLMSAPEKTALAQLSVFEGGFTLASAEALIDLDACPQAPAALDVLQSLLDKSLLRQVNDHRFDLLSSVQEYAAEHLATPGRFEGSGAPALAAAQLRHCRHFAALSEREAVAESCIELANLVAACRRGIAQRDAACTIGVLLNCWAGLKLRGPFRDAVALAEAGRAHLDLTPTQRASVAWVAGSALEAMGRLAEAREQFDAGLADARGCGAVRQEALIACALGDTLAMQGQNDEARRCLDTALALAVRLGDAALQCRALNGLGALSNGRGDVGAARAFYVSALALARSVGDQRWQGGLLGNLGVLDHRQGRLADAREHFEQALRLAREAGDRRWESNMRCNLGLLLHEQGHPAEAQQQFEATLAMAREMGHRRLECTVTCNLGIVAESLGQLDTARLHHEAAVAVAVEIADPRSEGQFRAYLGLLYARLGRFGDARSCLDRGETVLTEVGDPLSLALLLCARAETEALAGAPAEAQVALARAEVLALDTRAEADSELGTRLAQARVGVSRG